jgi:uncharacterized protein (TIGR04255 family)
LRDNLDSRNIAGSGAKDEMAFLGDVERVLYDKNPLESVICQVRFPTILRVESELPSNFQDRIRENFPLFKESSEEEIAIPPEVAKVFGRQFVEAMPGRNYNFSSEDEAWQVSLTRDFLALTCRKYERWERFREQFEIPLSALLDVYKPSSFSRVGLRYRDLIRRSVLGISGLPWGQLLNANIAGELGDSEVAERIQNVKKEIVFELPDSAQARMIQVLGNAKGEQVYLIDTDFFTTHKTEVSNVWGRLGTFNRYARWIFRWCISEQLHRAMGPKSI